MVLFNWFSGNSGVKGWIFKCSQQSGCECCFTPNFQQFYCVKACFSYPSQAFTARVWMLSCPCECFVFQAFILETTENQTETHVVWRGEYFFREIYHVYTRARKTYSPNGLRLLQCDLPASSARLDTAWCSFHKSPTIFYNSASWQNNSRTFGNNSRTF